MAGYAGGVTALCTLALLNSGVPADDPVDRQGARLSPRPRARQNLHRLAANDGPLRRRAQEGHAAHPPQRAAGSKRTRSKTADRKGAWSYPGPGRRQQQLAVRRARPVRRPARRRRSQPRNLAAGRRLLAQHAKRRRLLGLRARRRRHRQHDLRRHRRPGHVDRPRSNRATPPSRTAASSAAGRTRTTTSSTAPSTGSAEQFLGHPQSAPRRRRPVVPLLLSLRPGARRPPHRPPLHRRPRLVSRRRRVPGPRAGSALALLERQLARRAAIRTSARRWRCCSCPRAAGRS